MPTFNPCSFWSLPDGASAVAVYSAVFAVLELIIFGWQMAAISYERDRAANYMLPYSNAYGGYAPTGWWGGGYGGSYWPGYEVNYYNALYIIQIIALIVSIFLFFTSVMLIYGTRSWNRSMIWPWLFNMAVMVLICLAYCITWWIGYIRGYWVVLSLIEILCVFVNLYCLVVVYAFYKYIQEEGAQYRRGDGRVKSPAGQYGPVYHQQPQQQQQYAPQAQPSPGGYMQQHQQQPQIATSGVGYGPQEPKRSTHAFTPSSHPSSQRQTPMQPRYTPESTHIP